VDYNMQLSMMERINARLPLLGALSEREIQTLALSPFASRSCHASQAQGCCKEGGAW
jgi:hypothetical protein